LKGPGTGSKAGLAVNTLFCGLNNQSMQPVTLLGLSAAFCTTLSFLPQALKTLRTRNTGGISLLMYSVFTFGTFLWLLYGIFSADIPVAVANGITLIFAGIILIFKIRYK
jgi:MtN3 and saliva related transmembrane protein